MGSGINKEVFDMAIVEFVINHPDYGKGERFLIKEDRFLIINGIRYYCYISMINSITFKRLTYECYPEHGDSIKNYYSGDELATLLKQYNIKRQFNIIG